LADALACHKRIRVEQADHYATDAVLDDGLGARRLMAVVATGFEGDVHRGSGAVNATRIGIAEGVAFGMEVTIAGVIAIGHNLTSAHNDSADQRIGVDTPFATLSQRHRLTQKVYIFSIDHN
jgi:hypothetical protein